MNKIVDDDFKYINDVYVLQCICTDLKKRIIKENEFKNKVVKYIKENCIDDEFYCNLTNKEKSFIDVLTMLENGVFEND